MRTAPSKIDGVHFGGQVRVAALGIAESGEKHVWECGKERRRTPRWSREEGLEETLTVHHVGVGAALRRKLAATNPIESCLSTLQRVARNAKRWREGDEPLRWTAPQDLGSREEVPPHQRLSRNPVLEERLNPTQYQRAPLLE